MRLTDASNEENVRVEGDIKSSSDSSSKKEPNTQGLKYEKVRIIPARKLLNKSISDKDSAVFIDEKNN